jgi:hypothetical protein
MHATCSANLTLLSLIILIMLCEKLRNIFSKLYTMPWHFLCSKLQFPDILASCVVSGNTLFKGKQAFLWWLEGGIPIFCRLRNCATMTDIVVILRYKRGLLGDQMLSSSPPRSIETANVLSWGELQTLRASLSPRSVSTSPKAITSFHRWAH